MYHYLHVPCNLYRNALMYSINLVIVVYPLCDRSVFYGLSPCIREVSHRYVSHIGFTPVTCTHARAITHKVDSDMAKKSFEHGGILGELSKALLRRLSLSVIISQQ